jgi:uncharacterized protein
MYVAQLCRFPVKSLRGEWLESAVLTPDGVTGDRRVHVRQKQNVLTARTRPGLMRLAATTAPDGTVLVEGSPWDDPRATAAVCAAAGPGAELVRYEGRERFDVLPLLVATDGGIAALGYDGRRLRPNIVIGGVPGLAERSWPGQALRIGPVVIGMESLRSRCIVTTIHPDTGDQDLDVLRRIHRQFDSRVALNCWVARGGAIRVGDQVELAELAEHDLPKPERGGWIVGAPYLIHGGARS